MALKTKIITSLLSGVLMGLAPAPVNAWFCAWVAIAPLWFLIKCQKSLMRVIILALAWGLGYYGLALFWITGVHPLTWMGVPWLASLMIAIFCWVFITFWGSLIPVSWAVLYFLLNRRIKHQNIFSSFTLVLIGVSLWCGVETLWSHTPLWWSAIAYT
ncbi:MAG: apolipoprotein N-acyltransferase, partial [Cyanobacteria bacterium P01_A01_bin.83]